MGKRILVPIDATPQSWDALDHAVATYPDATFVALHVINPVDELLSGETYTGDVDRARQEAQNVCSEAEEIAAAADVDLATTIEHGRPARTIVDAVGDHNIDQIVMGSHGRTGASRVLLGSVAERVVRRASVPVTVVR